MPFELCTEVLAGVCFMQLSQMWTTVLS